MAEPTNQEIEHAANLLRADYLPKSVTALKALVREGIAGHGGRHPSGLPTLMLELDGLITLTIAPDGAECWAYARPTMLARRVVCVL